VEVLSRLEAAEAHARRRGVGEIGTLRLGTQCYTCYHWLPPLLEQFRRAHPGIRIEIKADTATDPVGALVDGRLDLALAVGPIQNPLATSRHLFNERMLVVMSPRHRLAARAYVRLADLQEEILLLHSRPEHSFVYERILAPAGVRPKAVETVALTEAIVELAKAGLGVGVVADWIAALYSKGRQLVARPLTQRGIVREWFAVTLKASRDVAYLRDFTDLVAAKSPPRQRRRQAD
jgi:LysR family transcriptional regulator for metE and metH